MFECILLSLIRFIYLVDCVNCIDLHVFIYCVMDIIKLAAFAQAYCTKVISLLGKKCIPSGQLATHSLSVLPITPQPPVYVKLQKKNSFFIVFH